MARAGDSGFLSRRERLGCFNVRKLGWYALRVMVVAFVLGSLLLLAANLYVQSHSVQQRIREAVEGSLKMPVHLQKTTLTPWDGLRLDGVVLRPEEPDVADTTPKDRAPDFFTASSFRVRFAWWPLIARQRVEVERVLLDKPRIVWQQDDDGHWSFPPGQDRVRLAEAKELARENAETITPTPNDGTPIPENGTPTTENPATPTPGSLPSIEKSATEAAEAARSKGFPLLISRLNVRHGEFTLHDRNHRPLVRIEEINADGAITDAHHLHGAVWFAKASNASSPGAMLTDYWTAVDYGDEDGLALAVRDGHGEIAGGSLQTDFRLEPKPDGPTFTSSVKLDRVALGQLTRGSGEQPPLAEGQFFGNLDCHGFADDPSSRVGGGRLWLVGAKLRDSAPLKLIGQILRISDLSHLEFKQADLDYKVEGKVLRIETLTLTANDVQIVARGRYLTDEDRLDVHGRLTIDQAVSRQLPQFIESNFTPCGPEAPGSRYLDFDVTGSANDPKCNLYDRALAGPMKGLLDNLLAPKAKNPRNKNRERETKARPTAEASAIP